MYLIKKLLVLVCLAALSWGALPAAAQGPAVLSNVTVTLANNLTGSFDSAEAPEGFGGGSAPSYRGLDGAVKMPGIAKMGSVVLTQGSFANNDRFWKLYNEVQMNTMARGTITLAGTDKAGNAVNWVLNNAWPSEVSGTDPGSGGGAVGVSRLIIAYENVQVQMQ